MQQKNFFQTAVSNVLQFGKGMGKILYDEVFKFLNVDGSPGGIQVKEVRGAGADGLTLTNADGGDVTIEQNADGELNLHKNAGSSPLSIWNSGGSGLEIQNNTGTDGLSVQNNSDGDFMQENNGDGSVGIYNNGGDKFTLQNSGTGGFELNNTKGALSLVHVGDEELSIQNNGSGGTSIRNVSAGKIVVHNTSGGVEVGSDHADGVKVSANNSEMKVSTANQLMQVGALSFEMDLFSGKGMVITDGAMGNGLKYAEDYQNLAPLSLVHKSYVDKAAEQTNVSKKMPIIIGADGAASGLSAVPANAHVVGAEVLVVEGFDGAPSDLKLEFGAATLIDFSAFDLTAADKQPAPFYAKEAAETLPTVTGSIDAGTQGQAVVLLEYIIAA